MSYFLTSPEEAGALASAFASATGAPMTAADLLGQAARDEALDLPDSAEVLRDLAAVRVSA